MKRVAIFSSAFHPSVGGVEELVRQLVLHFRESGCHALVCTNQWPRSLPAEEWIEGGYVRRFPFRIPWGGIRAAIRFPISVQRTLFELCEVLRGWKTELIHVQCLSSNGWYAKEAARILNLPLVITLQGERTMDSTGVYQRSPLFNRILRTCLDEAMALTACSQATLNDVHAYHGTSLADRGRVIYNGVGDDAFERGLLWHHARPYILGLGRMVPQKGFDNLLRAYARVESPKCDLLLAGDGPELAGLRGLSGELKLSARVHFVGTASRQRVGELIRGSRGLVVPSIREPMGIVALEGMAAGKPLLPSRVDGLMEIAVSGPGCRQIIPGNITDIAQGIRWLIDESPLFVPENIQRAGLFRWREIALQYLAVYREVCFGERHLDLVESLG